MQDRSVEVQLGELIYKLLTSRGMHAAFDNGEINRIGQEMSGDFPFSVIHCTFAGEAMTISVQRTADTAYAEDQASTMARAMLAEIRRPK